MEHGRILVILLCLVAQVLSCILKLDLPSRLEPSQIAKYSPVVLMGKVLKKLPPPKDSTTYAVNFEVERIIKGAELVKDVPSKEGVYEIHNFGPFLSCKSDVMENKWYILYLRVVNGHLSGNYEAVHGAANNFTRFLEEKLIRKLYGWQSWTEWSACSASCGTGQQSRTRSCAGEGSLSTCNGSRTTLRKCNLFSCSPAVKDLTALAGFEQKAIGVIIHKSSRKTKYYDITPNFYGQISASRLIRKAHWLPNFSILMRVRPKQMRYPREGQYLLSLADPSGRQYFGIRLYGTPTNQNPVVEFTFENKEEHGAQFPFGAPTVGLNDGRWHQIAVSVKGNLVTAYSNCRMVGQVEFPRWKLGAPVRPRVSRTTLILGSKMFKMSPKSNERFEGSIAQLVLTESNTDAALHCSKVEEQVPEEPQQKLPAPRSPFTPRCANGANTDDEDCEEELEGSGMGGNYWEWSEWSPCSVSCGQGVRVKQPYCKDETLNKEDCIPFYVQKLQQKCYEQDCPVCNCKNGGLCHNDGTCTCLPGWQGNKCQRAVCEQSCSHGTCIRPNHCSCTRGWTGKECNTPVCKQGCENGGLCVAPNSCQCPAGYGGQYCSLVLSYCIFPCRNGGKCVGHNKCQCADGFSGRFCHHRDSICKKPCQNGGKCVAGLRCKCPKGYSGKYCEIDSCGQCQNGGKCNSYTRKCLCPKLVTGPLCQHRVRSQTACRNFPCKNGGQCIGKNTCHCPEGWFGRDCKLKRCKTYAYKYVPSSYPVSKPRYRYFPCSVTGSASSNQHSILCRKFIGYKIHRREYQKKVQDYERCEEV